MFISFSFFVELYRLIHLVLSEYIQHVMESLQAKVIESQYNNILRPPIKRKNEGYKVVES